MSKRLTQKRFLAAVLWLFAGWYLGNLAAFQFGLTDLFGPVLGVVAALAVAGDPFGLIWTRADRESVVVSNEASEVTPVPGD